MGTCLFLAGRWRACPIPRLPACGGQTDRDVDFCGGPPGTGPGRHSRGLDRPNSEEQLPGRTVRPTPRQTDRQTDSLLLLPGRTDRQDRQP